MYSWEQTTDWEALRQKKTIEIDKAFYEICVAPKIHAQFPEYERRIAVGVVGEGSDCFGYDDEISRDHDFELGFLMWLNPQDYQAVGNQLQIFYESVISNEGKVFSEKIWGHSECITSTRIPGRRGVKEIGQFYAGILRLNFGLDKIIGQKYWMYAEPRFLATATNGEVFRDDEGTFTRVRNEMLGYYPAKTHLLKIAEQMHLFSHGGQSNYARMMARKDYVTAHICIDQTIQAAMQIAYLLDKKFPPYYKWTRRGLDDLSILPELSGMLEELVLLPLQDQAWENYQYSSVSVNPDDKVIATIDAIAALLVAEMRKQDMVTSDECFLESHVQSVVAKARQM